MIKARVGKARNKREINKQYTKLKFKNMHNANESNVMRKIRQLNKNKLNINQLKLQR